MTSALADTTLNFEIDPDQFFRWTKKFRSMEGKDTTQNDVNNTAFRNVYGGLNSIFITKTRLLKYNENFTVKKRKLSDENLW